ncbi:SubName: Full=Uncharacterized protein {ECO:0000313/EMBL:CCA67959.1} [Serendipita indica DSM 11827]|uniref:Ribosomal protein L19 n=1 Tax=Serendipita indica (strain DSM 11827) TaxID=1109443 RepID=G4T9G6_SERID|nr:SubName: Full=Uncharacterized protein {ECO:0000313/EMBL:CCA67959.1} [Serendipita indica DSM 11827]CCA67959.1 hypothetical protein PIIN_01827 [Serendipita indica DSM 11827]
MRPVRRLGHRAFSTSCKRKIGPTITSNAPSTSNTTAPTSTESFRPYPFSTKVQALPLPAELIPNDNRFLTPQRLEHPFTSPSTTKLRRGVGLMPYLARTLPNPAAHELLSTWFARRGKGRITPGSVLTVTLSQPPYTFSGVLVAIERKGVDSNILLRNVVRKTGVEMRVPLASPTLLGIKIIQRAGRSTMEFASPRQKFNANAKGDNKQQQQTQAPVRMRATSTELFSKDWKPGTPGPVPTLRVARKVGIIPNPSKGVKQDVKPVPVNDKDALIGKKMVRSKLYFLRDYPSKMSAISAGITKRD